MHNINVVTIFYVSYVLLHVSIQQNHLQGVLSFYFAKVTEIIKATKSNKIIRLQRWHM